jgi:hypothetical protein
MRKDTVDYQSLITTKNISQFNIVVTTSHQDIFDRFLETFIPTTLDYNVRLYVFHLGDIDVPDVDGIVSVPSPYLGNKAYLPLLQRLMEVQGKNIWNNPRVYWGVFNDDLIFSNGWLEDVVKNLEKYDCVTPGFINNVDMETFKKAVEVTKNDDGFVPYLMGACALMRLGIFLRIGMLDPQFDWSMDDTDLLWRIKLNGLTSVSLRKITIMHAHGASRTQDLKRWFKVAKEAKGLFCNKFGSMALKEIRDGYKKHNYFTNKEYFV